MIVNKLLSFGSIDTSLNLNEKVEYRAFINLKNHLKDISGLLYFKPLIRVEEDFIKPDILFFHPIMGLLIIEVKAWDKNFISKLKIDKNGNFFYKKNYFNPMKQVNRYQELISNELKLQIPITSLVYFPNLSKKDYDQTNDYFKYFFPYEKILLKRDNIKEKIISSLRKFHYISKNLTVEEFKKIREVLFPFLYIDKFNTEEEILDLYQEGFLYSLNKGYRILRGVAGSGKTTVLISKAIYEKLKDKNKKVLITTFTNALVSEIKNNLRKIIYAKNLPLCLEDFEVKTINELIGKREKKDVIICDECQDFLKEDFDIIKNLMHKDTIICFGVDETQRIYENRDWRWVDVGFNARGRVTILKVSYRNPTNISSFAKNFLFKDKKLIEELKELDIPIEESISFKEGEKIDLFYRVDLVSIVKNLLKTYEAKDIFVLTPFKKNVDIYVKKLKRNGIECYGFSSLSDKEDKQILDNKLMVMTYHSSKGLERDVVIVADIDYLPYKSSKKLYEKRRDRKLAYVAFTRAKRKLIITLSNINNFAKEVVEILKEEK